MPAPVTHQGGSATASSAARRMFFSEGRRPAALMSGAIIESWQRCLSRGMQAAEDPEIIPLTVHELNALLAQHEGLRRLSRPEMEALGAVASATQSVLVLADPHGFVLETLGDTRFMSRAAAISLSPGAAWSETSAGTNAIGATLNSRRGALVRGSEHYFEPHGILSCAAKAILDPRGEVIGVLDLSGPAAQAHPHTLGMIEIAVSQIEHRQFDAGFEGADVMTINRDARLLGTAREGVLVFEGARLVAASSAGLACAGLDFSAIGAIDYEDIFREKLTRAPHEQCLRGRNNARLFGRFRAQSPRLRAYRAGAPAAEIGVLDACMAGALEQALTWAGAGLATLIEGESGTGKTQLARMVHAQVCPDAPLVEVDCAQENLSSIEAQLFGQDGVFSRPGATLLLEEFTALPEGVQRQLQLALNREGAGARCILALSSRDCEEARLSGAFRSDLFYTLAQCRLTLAPLRERADLAATARRLLVPQGATSPQGDVLEPEALAALLAHDWPGNMREFLGTLRAARTLARHENERIGLAHLPPHMHIAKPKASPQTSDLNALTRAAMEAALAQAGGNVSRAARALGVDRTTLYRRLLWKKQPQRR